MSVYGLLEPTLDLQRDWTPAQAAALCGTEWGRPEGPENIPCGAWAVWSDAFAEAVRLGLVEIRHCQRRADGSVDYFTEEELDAFWALPIAQRKKHPRSKAMLGHEGASWCEWRRIA